MCYVWTNRINQSDSWSSGYIPWRIHSTRYTCNIHYLFNFSILVNYSGTGHIPPQVHSLSRIGCSIFASVAVWSSTCEFISIGAFVVYNIMLCSLCSSYFIFDCVLLFMISFPISTLFVSICYRNIYECADLARWKPSHVKLLSFRTRLSTLNSTLQ